MRVALDYGHGGLINSQYQTAGKRYIFTSENLTVYEGVINREISWRLANLLLQAGHQVYDVVAGDWLSYPTAASDLEQADTSLGTRVRRSNAIKPDLYVSVHNNAAGDSTSGSGHSANGFSVYTSPGNTRSDIFAEAVYSAAATLPLKIRKDTKDGDSDLEEAFYVLKETTSPAILLECGFFTNLQDAKYLLSSQGQEELARVIYQGIVSRKTT